MLEVVYGTGADVSPEELVEFYRRLQHDLSPQPEQIRKMTRNSAAFVTTRLDGKLIGIARGVCDGLRGYLTECKLDPAYQGPAAVTRTDGRIEHDTNGIATEMARRVLDAMFSEGVQRVDLVAYGTEVDFCQELGFRQARGLVGMTMRTEDWAAQAGTRAADLVSTDG
ncbi:MAG: GNAT family N-acetyltransferase [Planctomycetota bacterium]